jgi:hypothetical protein
MHIRCPNCERSFQPEAPSDDERYTCSGCNRLIYVDARGIFPAISAMTYPGANLDAQPLRSFFFMAIAQDAPTKPMLQTTSLDASPSEPSPEPVPTMHQAAVGPFVAPPPPPLDELPIEAMGAGSFAPSPPPRAANLGGLVPPPWEQNVPPPLAKTHEESWSVPNPGAPPPVPKKNEADEFAKALGLPDLGSLGVHHAPAQRTARPSVGNNDDEVSEPAPQKSLTWLYVLLAASLLTGGAVFAALRTQPKPLPPKFVQDAAEPPAAPTQASNEAAAAKPAEKSPARADAIDHYTRGNKLYLQKKLPAAVDEFKKAIELDGSFGLAHRGLGVAYASQGKGELAIKEYKAYLKISPDAKDAKQVEALVKNFEK